MPERRWKPKPAVLSVRRLNLRNVLITKTSAHYHVSETIKPHSELPPMDSIWEWNKDAGNIKGSIEREVVNGESR